MAKAEENVMILDYCARSMLPQILILQKTARNILRRKNIEDIHDLRVASRRIRTCLNLFSEQIPSKKSKLWSKDIKAITQSYGHVRDLDVQIMLLTDILNSTEDKKILAGIKRIRLRLRQKRAKLETTTKALTVSILESPILLEMQAWAESALTKPEEVNALSTKLFQLAYSRIQSRLDEFLFFEVFIFDPDRIQELHQMRIAVKHLRYALEIFSDLYSTKTNFALDITRKIQQILGEIHDADVWKTYLPKFSIQEQEKVIKFYGYSSPFKRLTPGIEFLFNNRRQERERLYTNFLLDWKKWKMKETWLDLRKTIFLSSASEQNNLRSIPTEIGKNDNITD